MKITDFRKGFIIGVLLDVPFLIGLLIGAIV